MTLSRKFSGITFLLICTSIGLTLGLDCITCTWDAYIPDSVNSSELCLSNAHLEMNKTCPKVDNMDNICEIRLQVAPPQAKVDLGGYPPLTNFFFRTKTKIEYHVIGKLKTIKKLTRGCEYDHPDCNKPCIPVKDTVCYQCCSRFNNCNTLPLTLSQMNPASDASINAIKTVLYYVTLSSFVITRITNVLFIIG